MTAVLVWASCPRCALRWEATVVEGETARETCSCGTELVVSQQHSGARAVAALAEIRKLHEPIEVCRGCSSSECDGGCESGDDCGGELLTVCAQCCIDGADHYRRLNDMCLDLHEHEAKHDQIAPCPTMVIIARAEL